MLFSQNDKSFYRKKSTLNLNGHLIDLSSPLVMGILNITPDSFYESFYWGNIVARAKKSLINLTHTE